MGKERTRARGRCGSTPWGKSEPAHAEVREDTRRVWEKGDESAQAGGHKKGKRAMSPPGGHKKSVGKGRRQGRFFLQPTLLCPGRTQERGLEGTRAWALPPHALEPSRTPFACWELEPGLMRDPTQCLQSIDSHPPVCGWQGERTASAE